MSEETLRRFLERLNEDASFREGVQADPEGAFAAHGLGPSQQVALMSGDVDTLRRLAGGDVAGFMMGSSSGASFTSRCTVPRPTNTPGSGNHCGTGPGGDYFGIRIVG